MLGLEGRSTALALALAVARSVPRDTEDAPAERHRRDLLALSDRLLDEIEELRLADSVMVPDLLRHRLRQLLAGLGRGDAHGPLSLRGAHHLVLALQGRLMAANPRRPRVAAQLGRGPGASAVRPLRPGLRWKLIALPPEPETGLEERWLGALDATVERAFDRWCYAQHHAVRAARRGEAPDAALVLARVAWNNYWELAEDARRIRLARGAPGGPAECAPAPP